MKKTFSILLAVALMTIASSCNKTEQENVSKASVNMYNFVEKEEGTLSLTRGVTKFEFNYDKKLVSFDANYTFHDGTSASVTSGVLPMTVHDDGYHFGRSNVSGVDIFGCYDSRMAALKIDYVQSGARVHSLANFVYAFTRTKVWGGAVSLDTDRVVVVIDPTPDGKAILALSGLQLDTYSSKDINLVYKDIPYTVGGTGFVAKAERVEDTQKYVDSVISNLNIEVKNYGLNAHLDFEIGGNMVSIDGTLFYQK